MEWKDDLRRANQWTGSTEGLLSAALNCKSGDTLCFAQRGRPLRERRQEREQESQSSLSVGGYFLKSLFLVDQSEGSTETLGITYFTFLFCSEEFQELCWGYLLVTILVFPCCVGMKAWTFNLALTLKTFFEVWTYCTSCMSPLESIKGRVKIYSFSQRCSRAPQKWNFIHN